MIKYPETILATTSLEDTWGADQNILFLGEWCKKYSRRHVWEQRKSSTQIFHWADRSKLARDHKYLAELHERVLSWLSDELNRIHDVNHSNRYWRIILGPWLLTFIPAVWSNWEQIRRALDEYPNISVVCPEGKVPWFVPRDSLTAEIWMFNDEWNYLVCLSILRRVKGDRVTFLQASVALDFMNNVRQNRKYSFKHKIARFFDSLLGLLHFRRDYQVVIFDSYFPITRLLSVFFKLGQIPRLFREFDERIAFPEPDYCLRKKIMPPIEFSDDFENFLASIIPNHIPVANLEGYGLLKDQMSRLPTAKVIMTASIYATELLKVWVAEQINLHAKLVVASHGGAIPSRYAMAAHEEKISDIKASWNKPCMSGQVQMTPTKITKAYKSTKEKIILVGIQLYRYPGRACCGPSGPLMLDEIKQKTTFIDGLNERVRGDFLIRLQPDQGWETEQRFIDLYGEDVMSTKATLIDDYSRSKLIICSYAQTTFSEAMHSNVPTVLLYLEKVWEFEPSFNNLVEKLKSVNIMFSDSKLAAEHVNSIADSPEIWWNRKDVQEVRDLFFEMCALQSLNPSNDWSQFMKSVLNE